MPEAFVCPKCGKYIVGTFCFTCKEDIRSMSFPSENGENFVDFFNNIINKGKK